MKRWHEELPRTLTAMREGWWWNRTRQLGRFRKKDAWDCGRSRCAGCHSDKYPKRTPTRHEEESSRAFREQLAEMDKPE